MAKRICFAWSEFWYDFDTKEEADQYMKNNRGKGWFFVYDEPYKGYGDDDPRWCVAVRKPYDNVHNTGW